MSSSSIVRSAGLPHEGQSVKFVLDGRDVVMDGKYVDRSFRSRWSGYDRDRVTAWRPADVSDSLSSARSLAI